MKKHGASGAMGNIVGTLVTTFTTVINLVSVFVARQRPRILFPFYCDLSSFIRQWFAKIIIAKSWSRTFIEEIFATKLFHLWITMTILTNVSLSIFHIYISNRFDRLLIFCFIINITRTEVYTEISTRVEWRAKYLIYCSKHNWEWYYCY